MLDTEGRPWIAYVGPFEFPWGRAASRRVYFVAKAIASLGLDVRVGAAGAPRTEFCNYERLPGSGSIGCISLAEFPISSGLQRAIDWSWRMGHHTVQWLNAQPTMPSHVIVYGGSLSYTRQVLSWAAEREVRVILDLVEWYDKSAFRGGFVSPQYWAETYSRRRLHRKADGIIAISSFLARYYARLGMPVAIVPPGAEPQTHSGRKMHLPRARREFVYAGTPGRKDNLAIVFDALDECERIGLEIGLTICGPTPSDLREIIGRDLPPYASARGNLPQADIADIVAGSDFSVLIRPDRRSSHAGFPTKFVESISAGTPVIANLTSDLPEYLQSGYNGIVVESTSFDAVFGAFHRAATIPRDELELMRANAIASAARFYWSESAEQIASLLQGTAP